VAPSVFEVLDASGEVVAEGKFGDVVELPPGAYRFRASLGGESMDTTFHVAPGATVKIVYAP
jgi:hypothetical protein